MGGLPHSREVKERAYALILAGFDKHDIAFVLGVSERSLRRWMEHVRRHGDVDRLYCHIDTSPNSRESTEVIHSLL